MKVLFIKSGIHHKNLHFILNCKTITFFIVNSVNNIINIDLTQFDAVFSPCEPINVSKYPNTKFIFGPHFSVFPEKNKMNMITGKNIVYIQPSNWVVNLWKSFPICQNIRIETLPFGVDTYKFNEIKSILKRDKVFIYFKTRHPTLLNIIQNFLNSKGINYVIFNYNTRYDENTYIDYLKNSKYGIWIGRHESQGFALEEALSCNVPLFVWDVTSMNEEYGYNYDNIPATCIPYWDNRCGEYFTDIQQLDITFEKFIKNLTNYKPREYILENISFEKCEEKFINIINGI
jgi:glycosyltransferase involved in cell wall biosynthesis